MEDDGDLESSILSARASRLGRELEASDLADLTRSTLASEQTYRALRARPIGLLSGQTDHALGDAWLRSPARGACRPPSSGDE